MRLIVADDHARVREELRRTLELVPDVEVVGEAANGMEALRLVEEQHPDVVLLDARMPVMDGFETTRRIKQRWSEVRVVALTMYQDCREAAVAAGADAFVVKGAPLLELLAAVRGYEEST